MSTLQVNVILENFEYWAVNVCYVLVPLAVDVISYTRTFHVRKLQPSKLVRSAAPVEKKV